MDPLKLVFYTIRGPKDPLSLASSANPDLHQKHDSQVTHKLAYKITCFFDTTEHIFYCIKDISAVLSF